MTKMLNINGADVPVSADADTPLLWVVRSELKLTGTKFGCGRGLCGACTVHVDGNAVRSCILPLSALESGQRITTIEGLHGAEADALRAAWTEIDVVQCGYCQSGQLMSACSLLKHNRRPEVDDVNSAMSGNICRCGTYPRIRKAISVAAKSLQSQDR